MTSCTATSTTTTTSTRSAWPLLCLLTLVLGAALLAACGGSGGGSGDASPSSPAATATDSIDPSSTPTSPSASPSSGAATSALTLCFLRDGRLGIAQRSSPQTTMPATAALKALLGGPTSAEAAAGLSSDIPAGTLLNGLSLDGGTATVDLSSHFSAPAANAVAARRVAEVVYTLTSFATIRRVAFLTDGEPLTEIPGDAAEGSPDPLPLSGTQARTAPWTSLEPAIFVERPGVGAVLGSPFTLSGTAGVFEGTFKARLVDADGGEIASATIQASRGAPSRGRYRQTLSFTTTSARGTLTVYSQSMEDGSRQNEVRIPVTFSPH